MVVGTPATSNWSSARSMRLALVVAGFLVISLLGGHGKAKGNPCVGHPAPLGAAAR